MAGSHQLTNQTSRRAHRPSRRASNLGHESCIRETQPGCERGDYLKMGAEDEYFKQAGAVPFKWEIKPGVPKHLHHRPSLSTPSSPNLKPPPAGSIYLRRPDPPPPRSILASPGSRSDRLRFDHSTLFRSEMVSSGCFPSPLQKRSGSSMRAVRKTTPMSEADYSSDLETLPRWKSPTPFRQSESLSSSPSVCMSRRPSPRPAGDSEWAGFGLF